MSDRILIADDHMLVRDTMAAVLEAEGFAVMVVADQPAACRVIRADGPFALVLTDWEMPGLSLRAGLSELIALNRPHPVALMAGSADRQIAEAVLAAGAAGFVPKSMPMRSLVHAAQLMLAGETYAPLAFAQSAAAAAIMQVRLSPRETEVLTALCRGLANKEIARELGVAEVTVKLHVRTLCRKLEARNRTHAAMIARDARMV